MSFFIPLHMMILPWRAGAQLSKFLFLTSGRIKQKLQPEETMHQKVLHPFCRHMHAHSFIFLLFLSIDGVQLGPRARCSLGDLLCPRLSRSPLGILRPTLDVSPRTLLGTKMRLDAARLDLGCALIYHVARTGGLSFW